MSSKKSPFKSLIKARLPFSIGSEKFGNSIISRLFDDLSKILMLDCNPTLYWHVTNILTLSTERPTTILTILLHPIGLTVFWKRNIFFAGSNKCIVNSVFASLTVIISVYLSPFMSSYAIIFKPLNPALGYLRPTSTSYKPRSLLYNSFGITFRWLLPE
jgi:hypothetical protein